MIPVPHPLSIQIVELITEDNNATEPIEKSNLPEFKLIDNANVASVTFAIALVNVSQCPFVANSDIPFAAQIAIIIAKVIAGIAIVHKIFFTVFI
ncbi:MAG: hypothetical protein Q4E53_14120 [Eubacteriales bacterium]|nr:hypothetical protein [Eubacteriales bacterium]